MDIYDLLLAKKLNGGGGGGSSVTVEELNAKSDGTYTAPTGKAYSPVNVQTEIPYKSFKDVICIDYDGTAVGNYTAQEFLALESLPENPTHDGLVAQGWNWTLAEAKAFVQKTGFVCIGQNYKTDDDCTRIYLTIDDYTLGLENVIQIQVVSGTLTFDWGDGSQTETTSGTGYKALTHTYANKGNYVIKIKRSENGQYKLGKDASNATLFGGFLNTRSASAVTKVEIGDGCIALNRNCFGSVVNLEYVTIPRSVVTYGDGINGGNFSSNLKYGIKAVILPPSVQLNGGASFGGVQMISLHNFSTSSSITSNNQLFRGSINVYMIAGILTGSGTAPISPQNDYNLRYFGIGGEYTVVYGYATPSAMFCEKVYIPSSVTEIKDYAFSDFQESDIYLHPTTVPTLVNTRAFNNVGKMYVPYSADHSILEAYKTASNWSTYASIMEEMPQ